MTNLEAVKAVYVALGGSADTVANMTVTADVIKATATLISTQGISALPAVTAEDNGDVLTDVNGAWAKATPAGG